MNSTVVRQEMMKILEDLENNTGSGNQSEVEHQPIYLPESLVLCTRERPVLCLLLMLGTLWLGYALYLIKRRYVLSVNPLSQKKIEWVQTTQGEAETLTLSHKTQSGPMRAMDGILEKKTHFAMYRTCGVMS